MDGCRFCLLLLRDLFWSTHQCLVGKTPLACSALEELDFGGEGRMGQGLFQVTICLYSPQGRMGKSQGHKCYRTIASMTQLQRAGYPDITTPFHMRLVHSLHSQPERRNITFNVPSDNTRPATTGLAQLRHPSFLIPVRLVLPKPSRSPSERG